MTQENTDRLVKERYQTTLFHAYLAAEKLLSKEENTNKYMDLVSILNGIELYLDDFEQRKVEYDEIIAKPLTEIKEIKQEAEQILNEVEQLKAEVL
jgi:hypothetical protein